MSILTQGTHVFFLDQTGETPEVVKVQAATNFEPGGDPSDQLDDTDLDSEEYEYKAGLRNPGQGSLTIRADPKLSSHLKMYELSRMNPSPKVFWAVGWSDGEEAPRHGYGVDSVSVGDGGSGYSESTTTVVFSDPEDSAGTTAKGVATVVDGVVTDITVTDPGRGYSAAPTVTINDSGTGSAATATATLAAEATFVFPGTRTWFRMKGYISDFPFSFSTNSLVQTELAIQRSGGSGWIKKEPA